MFPHQNPAHDSPFPTLATHPANLRLDLITLKKLMRNGDHEYPRHVAFPIPLLSHPFYAKTLSSTPYVRQQSACTPPQC